MRTLGGILLLVALALQLLLGGVYIMASRYEPVAASAEAPEPAVSAGRQMGLGVAALAGGVALLVAWILRRRALRVALALVVGAAVAQAAVQLIDGPITVGLIALVLTVVALGALALAGRGTRETAAARPSSPPEEAGDRPSPEPG